VSIPWSKSDSNFDELWLGEPDRPAGVPDILQTMFKQQREHMEKYAEIAPDAQVPPELWGDIDNRQVQAAVREFASYTVEELYEAINHLKNKPWKQTDKTTDLGAFHEELADAWHFWIEMHIIAGIDPTAVFRAYFAKTLINKERQSNGY